MGRYVNFITRPMNFVSTESQLARIIYLQDCLAHKSHLCFECCYANRCGDGIDKQQCDILRKLEYDDLISTKLDELSALIGKSTTIFKSELEKIELRRVKYYANYKACTIIEILLTNDYR